MNYETIKNQQISGILRDYEHYGYMTGEELQSFWNYRDELRKNFNLWKDILRMTIKEGKNPVDAQIMVASMTPEVTQMEYLNKWKIYNGSMASCYTMNGILRALWDKEFSGYINNPFFDFQNLVKQVNAYWKIETPYKAPNKIAYGWKFSMEKADHTGYYSKSWRLYMWGCIKNYLIKNGIEFTKDESLKVRKIVGLAEIYTTTE